MRITSFTVNNFRSIKSANSIQIGDKCVIIGPNNEGKSNILQGLALCLSTFTDPSRRRYRRPLSRHRYRQEERVLRYEWERDYPVDLQCTEPNGNSLFKLTLTLTDKEKGELSALIHEEATNEMAFEVKFGKDNISVELDDKKKGKKRKKETEMDLDDVYSFFNQHLSFHYIPAIRPTEFSIDIVESLLEEALLELDTNKEYTASLKQLELLQKPILTSLSNQLTSSIKEFIPEVKKVEVITEGLRRVISRALTVQIEDNAKTSIEQKGDGIKSLIAISLVKHSVQYKLKNRSMILALEEPESHLHPAAIHRLNNIIHEISQQQQVIITTHSPLLVDRHDIARNVLVNKQKAQQADSIISIRDTIGVHVSDNLTNSSWVLLVEGKSDEKILRKWLSSDAQVKHLFDENIINVDSLAGGSNFSYKISLFNSMLCNVLFFLDDDECGRKSFEEAKRKSLIDVKEGVFSIVPGRKESEIEDMIVPEVYIVEIQNRFGVDLSIPQFKKLKHKWSDRVSRIFRDSGKQWNDRIEEEVKTLVAECVVSFTGLTIKTKAEGPILGLQSIIKTQCKK